MVARELVLGGALIALAACATAPAPAKPRALTPAERDSLSQILEPLLLEERLRAPNKDAWAAWLKTHPVSAERIEALAAPCPGAASP